MFLSAQNIKPYRFIPQNHKCVSYEDYLSYIANKKAEKGDILLTRVGAGIGGSCYGKPRPRFCFLRQYWVT
jgi:type I restriction enzyme S subunit